VGRREGDHDLQARTQRTRSTPSRHQPGAHRERRSAIVLTVETNGDGGNPREPSAIERVADDRVRVAPESEDGDANYKFALNVRVTNSGPTSAPLTLEIEWNDLIYRANRCFVHVGQGDHWTYVPAQVEGSRTIVQLEMPPGSTDIGVSPGYGWEQFRTFAAQVPPGVFRREVLGYSAQGHPIEAFHVGAGAERIVVLARAHPYETAASYGIEGVPWWVSAGDAAQQLLATCHLVIVPLSNPDGVVLGLCKRTAVQGGVDLSQEGARRGDATAAAVMQCLDDVRPARLLDLHGWMWLHEDGLSYIDAAIKMRFVAAIGGHPPLADTIWRGWAAASDEAGLLRYCTRMFGTAALEVSYRWPERTVTQMRAIGAATIQAFCTM